MSIVFCQDAPAGDDDDDIDLFGDETEEEKKAAEEREASKKASSKKKESMCTEIASSIGNYVYAPLELMEVSMN